MNNVDEVIVHSLEEQVRPCGNRFGWLIVLFVLIVGILLSRSFYLQIFEGASLHLQAEDNRVALIPQIAPRGIIYDKQGKQLVENIASTDLILDPLILPSEEHEAPLVEGLNNYLDMTPDQVVEALAVARNKARSVLLAKALDHEQVIELEGALHELPGVRLVSSSVRNYLYPHAMAHLLGYTGLVTTEELRKNDQLLMNDITGKAGIEKQQDKILRGKAGASYVEVNAAGHPQKELGLEAPDPGLDATLTVNAELQEFIFNLLAEQAKFGSVVVIDPRSGAVRGLVNYPAYDPNIFSQPGRHDESSTIFRDERQPLFNRAIGGTYPPGSTIKPLIAAAGLQEGLISPTTSVLSTGGLNIGIWSFPDWKSGGHGVTDVKKAIAESVNTFFYLLSGGDESRRGLGVRRISKYLNDFSWGQPTGIDLPGEVGGLLPSPEWKIETKNEQWYIGDTYHLGIGQGDVLVTPLQVAVATAAIANGGQVYEPHVLSSYLTSNGKVVENKAKSRRLDIKPSYLKTVRQGMRLAVTEGSARRLNELPINTAGKTGTAQFKSDEESTHAWFTSFGPYEKPQLVITILLEEGGKGDIDAVPIVQEIWQWWVEHQ